MEAAITYLAVNPSYIKGFPLYIWMSISFQNEVLTNITSIMTRFCWEGVEFIQLVYCIIIFLSFLNCD